VATAAILARWPPLSAETPLPTAIAGVWLAIALINTTGCRRSFATATEHYFAARLRRDSFATKGLTSLVKAGRS